VQGNLMESLILKGGLLVVDKTDFGKIYRHR
jgi:hypothetical protein